MSPSRSGTVTEVLEMGPGGPRPRPVVRRFSFPGLEKVPRDHARLMRRLEWLLPEGLLSGEFNPAARDRLRQILDDEVRLWLDCVHLASPRSLPKLVSEPTFLAVVAPSPHGARGLVEVELALAHGVVDHLLGASSGAPVARPLTQIEEGVLAYLLLELFKGLCAGADPERHPLRLERVVSRLADGLALFSTEKTVALVELKALMGGAVGFLRFLLPGSLLSSAVEPSGTLARRARCVARIQAGLGRLAGIRTALRVEIGRADLTHGDLAALRSGDVLLMDEVTARPDRGEGGTATLRLGAGRVGYLEARLEVVEGALRATIGRVVIGEPEVRAAGGGEAGQPRDEAADGGEGEAEGGDERAGDAEDPADDDDSHTHDEKTNVTEKPAGPSETSAAELLNDVPLQVVVELTRLSMNAEEVAGLHTGQLLELNKAPGEPVDLSVNGRLVARGELVEIEGKLGVRVLTLNG